MGLDPKVGVCMSAVDMVLTSTTCRPLHSKDLIGVTLLYFYINGQRLHGRPTT